MERPRTAFLPGQARGRPPEPRSPGRRAGVCSAAPHERLSCDARAQRRPGIRFGRIYTTETGKCYRPGFFPSGGPAVEPAPPSTTAQRSRPSLCGTIKGGGHEPQRQKSRVQSYMSGWSSVLQACGQHYNPSEGERSREKRPPQTFSQGHLALWEVPSHDKRDSLTMAPWEPEAALETTDGTLLR